MAAGLVAGLIYRTVHMAAFHLDQEFESINGGAARYDVSQMYPVSGNIASADVGTGAASGLTTFQWQDSTGWWSPQNSYFLLQLQFTAGGTNGIPGSLGTSPTNNVTYCDNFVHTLFTQIQSQIDSRPLDTVNTPHIIDTALTYSKAHNNFLKTWGSLTRVGEPLATRIKNVKVTSTANTLAGGGTNGLIDVVFRPPISLFDCKVLPPGAQFRVDFNWASSAILAFESVDGSIAIGNTAAQTPPQFNINVQGFSFFKAMLQPESVIHTPDHGIVELCPAVSNQYFLNSTDTLRQNITLPGTTNKLYVVFQDTNATAVTTGPPPVDNVSGVGNGYQPATSFTHVFTTSTGSNRTFTSNTNTLNQLWLDLPELGITEPKPVYNFGARASATSLSSRDLMRAYSDFCHISQGTHDQAEGSVPFGNFSTESGITIFGPGATVGASNAVVAFQQGDLNNPQQLVYSIAGSTTVPVAQTWNQLARWGWAGRIPGPIFAFPVVRPENKLVSNGTLNVVMNANVINVSVTTIACYSMALVCQKQPNGLYAYSLVQSV